MSEVMLHGVLNMPIEIWGDGHLDKIQRHSRYVEASELIRLFDQALRDIALEVGVDVTDLSPVEVAQIVQQVKQHVDSAYAMFGEGRI